MAGKKTFAVIGLRVLEAMGVRSVLRQESAACVEIFGCFREFAAMSDRIDAYIVSAETFAGNLDFFLPRKNRTVVVGGDRGEKASASLPLYIAADSDECEVESVVRKVLESLCDSGEEAGELSLREKEVIRLVASGKINKEIADELCISVNTVITHRKNIASKIGVKSASGLSLYAIMNGLI